MIWSETSQDNYYELEAFIVFYVLIILYLCSHYIRVIKVMIVEFNFDIIIISFVFQTNEGAWFNFRSSWSFVNLIFMYINIDKLHEEILK